MCRHRSLTVAVLAVSYLAITWTAPSADAVNETYRLTGPYSHDNLAIYLIHREGADREPVPLTLGEAMEQGLVKVTETGDVEELLVRNLGGREVFIQAGDIVKGGMQDRVLTVSMILPANSGDISIGAFCVEQGRWARRGQEKEAEFSVSTARLPSQAGRKAIALRMRGEVESRAGTPARPDGQRRGLQGESLQSQVWDSVREMQENLGMAMAMDVADERSRSSLQLSLENPALASALESYQATLAGLPQEHPGAVGYVLAINGKINGGDEFASAALFRKLWPRQLKAAATEAITEENTTIGGQPTLAEIAAFIDGIRAAEPAGASMPGRMSLETRETEQALYTEIRRRDGRWIHRSFVAYE